MTPVLNRSCSARWFIKRALVVTLLSTATAPFLSATTVVAIRYGNGIVIASDSLLTRVEDTTGAVSRSKVCKIHSYGTTVFALAGTYVSTREHLDVPWAIEAEIRRGGNLSEIASRVADVIADPLWRLEQRNFREAPRDVYKTIIASDVGVASFVIAGMEGDKATFAAVDFTRVRDATGKPIRLNKTTMVCPSATCMQNPAIVALGLTRNIQKRLKTGQGWSGDAASVARSMVELEILENPQRDEGPVDVIVIQPSGARWQRPLGSCQEVLRE